ncbi:MAG: FkbM family methyltransferase [Bacteroidales bacterium]|nr:FkbM family methyltransferase [Bacteroidales bacterium]
MSRLISIIMPVFNGGDLVSRALDSVLNQSFPDWELLIVNDGSTDQTPVILEHYSTRDRRIRVFHHAPSRGVSVARNAAIAAARGDWIAYLDHDDEYYPDYLGQIWQYRQKGGVLVFRYDLMEDRVGHPHYGRFSTYDPSTRRHALQEEVIAVPLGVAHQRVLLDRVGGFDEHLRREVDGDLWRRLARAGAQFWFCSERSGRYHIRSGSLSRMTPPATARLVDVSGPDGQSIRIAEAEVSRLRDMDHKPFAGLPDGAIRSRPTVVEVGAYVGLFACTTFAEYPDAIVHGFEPYPPSLTLLHQNTAGWPGMRIYPCALAQADGTLILRVPAGDTGACSGTSGWTPSSASQIPVPVRSAAAVWDELGLDPVDILNLDCGGAEVTILTTLAERVARIRVIRVAFFTPGDRARIASLLSSHIGVAPFPDARASCGILRFVRADLIVRRCDVPAFSAVVVKDSPRVLFASYHCYSDPASGAAICTRDLFSALAQRDWRCGVVTGPRVDAPRAVAPGVPWDYRGPTGFVVRSERGPGGFPVTVFSPDSNAPRHPPTPQDVDQFRTVLREVTRQFRPDVVLTYGGDPASLAVQEIARECQARLVFWLHNLAYTGMEPFQNCDAVVVPSESSRFYYRSALGIDPVVLPPVIDTDRILTASDERTCLTFVNPEPAKGLLVFARLAEWLAVERPDIPLLVVEARARADRLTHCGLHPAALATVRWMPNSPDPRTFYRLARVVLVPSVGRETFGRVAAEALLNGIPVIASDRGALPEVVGDGGCCLSLPATLTPASRTVPPLAELEAWISAIVQLWSETPIYDRACASAHLAGQKWAASATLPRWEEFFSRLCRHKSRNVQYL